MKKYYACAITTYNISPVSQTLTDFMTAYWACVSMHNRAVAGILRSPMQFFDSQPIGRILSRFTADVEVLDAELVFTIITFIYFALGVVSSAVAVVYANTYALIAFAVLVVIAAWLFLYFRKSYRELKRPQSIMRSPLSAHISESLNGFSSIVAYCVQDDFVVKQRSKVDLWNKSGFFLDSTQFWVGLRLQLSSSLITLCLLILICTRSLSGSDVGLALVATIGFGEHLNELVLYLGKLEASFNSVERLNHYAYDLPSEAPRQLPTDPDTDAWPTKGAISFKDLEIRYPSRLNHAVIDRLSIDILSGEKVAVVGRTGSGKSTLMTALFRIVEASSGSITVEGINIAKLGLRTLCSRLQIIPQTPVLFDGTIRSNIDMHGSHFEDETLWDALEMVGLKDYVASLDGKLDAHVDEGGSNLSAGQRQLLCLCRSILARPKVLVMDEATASVDADADRRIQAAVTSEFRNTTVLSIAHRLNTIAAYDKVVECDAPHVLLEKPGSVFGGFVDPTGQANSAAIREVAAIQYASSVYK